MVYPFMSFCINVAMLYQAPLKFEFQIIKSQNIEFLRYYKAYVYVQKNHLSENQMYLGVQCLYLLYLQTQTIESTAFMICPVLVSSTPMSAP